MGSVHQDRKEERARHADPINFTCGECRKVHKFNGSYDCTDKKEEIEGDEDGS